MSMAVSAPRAPLPFIMLSADFQESVRRGGDPTWRERWRWRASLGARRAAIGGERQQKQPGDPQRQRQVGGGPARARIAPGGHQRQRAQHHQRQRRHRPDPPQAQRPPQPIRRESGADQRERQVEDRVVELFGIVRVEGARHHVEEHRRNGEPDDRRRGRGVPGQPRPQLDERQQQERRDGGDVARPHAPAGAPVAHAGDEEKHRRRRSPASAPPRAAGLARRGRSPRRDRGAAPART